MLVYTCQKRQRYQQILSLNIGGFCLSAQFSLFSCIFAGSLESANSSILAACRHFKEVVGEKNQDFIIMSLVNPSNLIGCGGDI